MEDDSVFVIDECRHATRSAGIRETFHYAPTNITTSLYVVSVCVSLRWPIILGMSISERIQKDMIEAMKAKSELRLSTLRMVKSALKNKEIDKRAALDEKEEMQVLSTLIKQRKDSAEQFTNGNRPELAKKELEEIVIIEDYLPKAVGEAEINAAVAATIAEMGSPTMKDMGLVMKATMAKFAGARVDGKLVSEAVKKALSK